MKKESFTLLEMLIVLGIIAVVITFAAVSYSNAQKKGRDARRKSDIKMVQNAMEQYYSVCGFQYPVASNGLVPTILCVAPSSMILQTVPVDPRGGTPYPLSNSTTSTYQICTTLESEAQPNYCVANQQ